MKSGIQHLEDLYATYRHVGEDKEYMQTEFPYLFE